MASSTSLKCPLLSTHYSVGKTIGEGTFGKVKKGIHKLTGVKVAIKILVKKRIVDAADRERVDREIEILKRIRHPNVVRLFEVIDTAKFLFLIMEFANQGELFDYIVAQGRVASAEACKFFHHIVNGVDYFHGQNVIHRDLKPENLLLDKHNSIKIVDFGLGNLVRTESQLMKTACGSPCYAAPEMIAGKRYVGFGADIWSLGVILFALVCGYLPFEDASTPALYRKIMSGSYTCPPFLASDCVDLIGKLLNTDPKKRYSIAQIRAHPWYKKVQCLTDPLTIAGAGAPAPGSVRRLTEESIDKEVLRQMVSLGYQRTDVLTSVCGLKHDHNSSTYDFLELRKLTGGGPLNAAPRPINPHASGSVTERGYSSNSRQQTLAGAVVVPTLSDSQTPAAAAAGGRGGAHTTRYRPVLKTKTATRRGVGVGGKPRAQKPTSSGRSTPHVSSVGSADFSKETLHGPQVSRAPSRVSHNVQVSTRVRVKPVISARKSSSDKPPITPRTFLEDKRHPGASDAHSHADGDRVVNHETRKNSDPHVTEVSDISHGNSKEDSLQPQRLPTPPNSHTSTAAVRPPTVRSRDTEHSRSQHRDIIQSATAQLNSLALHVDPRSFSRTANSRPPTRGSTSRTASRTASRAGTSRPSISGSATSTSRSGTGSPQKRASQELTNTTIRAFLSHTVNPHDSSHTAPSDLNSRTFDSSQLESFSRSTSQSRPLSCSSQSSAVNPSSRISRYRVPPGGVRPSSVSESLAHTAGGPPYAASSSSRYRKYSHGRTSGSSSTYRSSAAPVIGFAKGSEYRNKRAPPTFGDSMTVRPGFGAVGASPRGGTSSSTPATPVHARKLRRPSTSSTGGYTSTWSGGIARPKPYSSREASKILSAAEKRLELAQNGIGAPGASSSRGKSSSSSRPGSSADRTFTASARLSRLGSGDGDGDSNSVHVPPLRFQWLVQNSGSGNSGDSRPPSSSNTSRGMRATPRAVRTPSINGKFSGGSIGTRKKMSTPSALSSRRSRTSGGSSSTTYRHTKRVSSSRKSTSPSRRYTPITVRKKSIGTALSSKHRSNTKEGRNPYSAPIAGAGVATSHQARSNMKSRDGQRSPRRTKTPSLVPPRTSSGTGPTLPQKTGSVRRTGPLFRAASPPRAQPFSGGRSSRVSQVRGMVSKGTRLSLTGKREALGVRPPSACIGVISGSVRSTSRQGEARSFTSSQMRQFRS